MDSKKVGILVVVIIAAIVVLFLSIRKYSGPKKVSMEEQRRNYERAMSGANAPAGVSGGQPMGAPAGGAPQAPAGQ